MSVVLALDTSGHGAEVAVGCDGKLLAAVALAGRGSFAESLPGLLDDALCQAAVTLQAVEAVAVVVGPGSFTGLRIGIMTAKTLSFARGIPLLAAGTLELVAAAASDAPAAAPTSLAGCVAAALDAGAGHAFAAAYARADRGRALLLSSPLRMPARVALAGLPEWLAGLPPPVVLAARGEESLRRSGELLAAGACAQTVAADGLARRLAAGASAGAPPARAADPVTLVPIYISPSQAERKLGVDLEAQVHRPVSPRRERP